MAVRRAVGARKRREEIVEAAVLLDHEDDVLDIRREAVLVVGHRRELLQKTDRRPSALDPPAHAVTPKATIAATPFFKIVIYAT